MFKTKQIDMCNGPLVKNIIKYSIPIVLSGILQTLLSTVNMIVVGRNSGSDSLGAIGAVSPITSLLISMFIGIAIGAGAAVSHAIGGKRDDEIKKIVHTAIPFAFLCGIGLAVFGVFFTDYFLELINVPENFIELSSVYLKICFVGAIPSLVFNFGDAILRASGDTKSPLFCLVTGSVINVVFSIIFVYFYNLDVAGAGMATVLSQITSAGLVLWILGKRTDACRLRFKSMKIQKNALLKILRIGVPAGITDSFFGVCSLIIQAFVNSLGESVVTGTTAAGNVESFVYIITHAFYQANLSFIGQNAGAGNNERIKKIMKVNLMLVSITSVVCGLGARLFGSQLLGIYITDSPDAIYYGLIRMTVLFLPYILQGCMDVVIGGTIGLGSSTLPMLNSLVFICGMRLLWIYTVFAKVGSVESLFMCFPVSWFVTLIAQLLTFVYVYKKFVKERSLNGFSL